jgi:hypothetical protein
MVTLSWQHVPRVTGSAAVSLNLPQLADMIKVGSEGYVHGWVCVRPPCGKRGDEITHPERGHGIITGRRDDQVRVTFDDGTKAVLGKSALEELGHINAGDLRIDGDQVKHVPSGVVVASVRRRPFSSTKSFYDGKIAADAPSEEIALRFLAQYHNEFKPVVKPVKLKSVLAPSLAVTNVSSGKRAQLDHAVDAYIDPRGNSMINSELRAGKSDVPFVRETDEALALSTASEQGTFYRGLAVHQAASDALTPGKTFRELAYTSVTTNPAMARRFGEQRSAGMDPAIGPAAIGGTPVILVITTPAGQHMIHGKASESELILPRGSSFRVDRRLGNVIYVSLTGADAGSSVNVEKSAADLRDQTPVDAEHIYQQLLANYEPKGIAWVRQLRWVGPVNVPLTAIDWDSENSWAAHHQRQRVARFAERIRSGGQDVNPVILVRVPGNQRDVVIDGHHRALAYRQERRPVKAYIGFAPSDNAADPWFQAHSFQVHQGASSANKAEWEPVSFAARTTGGKIKIRIADLLKVGPEGYIHGYICVRPPCGRYQEARRQTHGGKTVAPSGHVIGRDLKREPGDPGYKIKYTSPIMGKSTVLGHFTSRQEASQAVVLYHNMHMLTASAQPNVQDKLLQAQERLAAGDHAGALSALSQAHGRADDEQSATHIDQLHQALSSLQQPGTPAAPLPPAAPTAPAPAELPRPAAPSTPVPTMSQLHDSLEQLINDVSREFEAAGDPRRADLSRALNTLGQVGLSLVRDQFGVVDTHLTVAGHRADQAGAPELTRRIVSLRADVLRYQEARDAEVRAAIAAALSSAVPKPLDVIPDWARFKGYELLTVPPSISPNNDTRNAIRKTINHATAWQGRYVPNLVARTSITVSTRLGSGRSTTLATHQLASRAITVSTKLAFPANRERREQASRYNNESGWWSGADPGHSAVDQTLAHEFGHGVDFQLRELLTSGNNEAYWHIWEQVAAAIGISRPQRNYYLRGDWVSANKRAISERVSKYGASDDFELAAELWSEYTMKMNPRRPARVFGDLVMHLLPSRTNEVIS